MPPDMSLGRGPPSPVYSESHVHEETLTLDTSAYADGDTLADVFRVQLSESWTVAILHEIYVLDEDDQGIAFDILFFKGRPATSAKNAAWNTSDAVMRGCVGFARVLSSDYVDWGGNRSAEVSTLARLLPLPNDRALWVATISRGAGTYSVNGITIKLGFLR